MEAGGLPLMRRMPAVLGLFGGLGALLRAAGPRDGRSIAEDPLGPAGLSGRAAVPRGPPGGRHRPASQALEPREGRSPTWCRPWATRRPASPARSSAVRGRRPRPPATCWAIRKPQPREKAKARLGGRVRHQRLPRRRPAERRDAADRGAGSPSRRLARLRRNAKTAGCESRPLGRSKRLSPRTGFRRPGRPRSLPAGPSSGRGRADRRHRRTPPPPP